MDLFEKSKKILNFGPLVHFPQGHIVAVSCLSLALGGFALLPSDKAAAKRRHQTIDIPIPTFDAAPDLPVYRSASEEYEEYNGDLPRITKRVEVRPGDNLSLIFKRAGLGDRVMMSFLNEHPETKRLASLYPGHIVEFGLGPESELCRLSYIIDRLNSFSFSKVESGFEFRESIRTPDIRLAQSSAFITQSLYTAGIDARLNDKLIMAMAEIFGWDIDFALDIRKGDHFKVVYEERFLDGEKIGNGDIIAAEFVNQGEVFQAVRYQNEQGEFGYYTPEGESMRKEFLRAPLDFRRISSSFNPRRLHPIFKTLKPHRGIDYAAPNGTPVWSSGSGRVLKSGYSKANGNYVVIQHGNNIQTKYLHLHKRYVKTGQRVKQKQKIGTVGSTGYATGPHLHYEFLLNGVHRNPRTIVSRLPKAKAIRPSEFSRFVLETRALFAQLNEDFTLTRYAEAGRDDQNKKL